MFFEPALELARPIHHIEGCRDVGPLGTVPDDFGAGAAAGKKLQGVNDDRFAGAGLAGQHRKARPPFEFDGVDDGEVADLQ